MLACATEVHDGLAFDPSVLRSFPDSLGVQHDEVKAGLNTWLNRLGLRWPMGPRSPPKNAPLHRSVYERFDARDVLLYDRVGPYRPEALRHHKDLAPFYENDALASSSVCATCRAREPLLPQQLALGPM